MRIGVIKDEKTFFKNCNDPNKLPCHMDDQRSI